VVWNQHPVRGRDSGRLRQKAGAAHRYYLAQTQQYVQQYRPQWVIWNKAALLVYRPDSAAVAARNARFAVANELYMGVTYYLVDHGFPARPGRNHLTIFSPQGQVVYDYVKNKPVAGLEPAVAAQTPPAVFRAGRVTYAGAICADFDYPGFIRQVGAADIVFDPAADWPGIRDLHARMAATRAVENGFALFRIAGQGKSSLTMAYGEVVRSQYHLAPEVQAFVATVPVQQVWTPYRAWGDVFAWLCVSSLLGLVALGRWFRLPPFSPDLISVPL
jgi:apolipoprotein N-acyltransferase